MQASILFINVNISSSNVIEQLNANMLVKQWAYNLFP